MNISFFILAGGYGLRAKPLSLFRPKPVFPLNGIPLINLLLKQIEKSGLRSGYINLHHLPKELKKFIDYKNIKYIFEENLSGSAVLNKVSQDTEYTLIINGDVFQEIPIKKLFKKIRETNADGVLLVRDDLENDYPKLIINEDKFIGKAGEGVTHGKMYASIGIFKTKILKHFNEKSFFSSLKKNNFDIRVLEYDGLWLDLGNPKQYYDAVFKYMKYTGLNNTNSISDSSKISKDSIVKNSILWDRVKISGNSNISNSIILDDVIIDNLTISNKIIYNIDKKLTLIDL